MTVTIVSERLNFNILLPANVEPRGFGFVTFTEYAAVPKVLDVLVHRLNDKIVSKNIKKPFLENNLTSF